MLPDIVAHDGIEAIHQRAVLVGGRDDGEFAIPVGHEPRPAGAEAFDTGIIEGGFEGVEGAESLVDGVGNGAGGVAAAIGRHNLPEHRVVGMATAVVAHGDANVLRHIVDAAHQVFDVDVPNSGAFWMAAFRLLTYACACLS